MLKVSPSKQEINMVSPQTSEEKLDCRVTVLTHYLPPYIARVLYHTQKQLRGLNVLLSVDQEPNRDFGNTWEGLSVEVQKSWMFRRPWKHSEKFTDELFVHVPYDTFRQLRRSKPDIVFSFELGFRSLASAIYCKIARKPLALCVCVSEHTEQGRGLIRNWLRKFLLKSAAAVTYNGPSCKTYLQKFGVPDDRLFHFPYSPSDQFGYEGSLRRSPEATHRFLCIGQLIERKGVMPLLEGMMDYCKEQPNRTVELDLIGKGPLEKAIQELQLPSNFKLRLFGHLHYKEMYRKMEEAGVLVFPTMADEWGLVVNEGLQAGLPILGSEYAQACTTLIREGHNGWLYRPDKPEEFHRKLDHILDLSPKQIDDMRAECQASVEHINSSSVANKAIDVFRACMQSR